VLIDSHDLNFLKLLRISRFEKLRVKLEVVEVCVDRNSARLSK